MEVKDMLAEVITELINERFLNNQSVQFRVFTSSMSPTILPGDCLIVHGVNGELPSPGDIVILRNDTSWVAHRLLRCEKTQDGVVLITKGDHTRNIDRPWEISSLCGIVVGIVRGEKRIELDSSRARIFGWWIARLSWIQACFCSSRTVLIGRLAQGLLSRILTATSLVVYGG